MRTVREIEAAFLAAWPALETVEMGAWCARFGNGLTRRANSIQCNDPEDDADPAARLAALGALYDARRLPPVFRVTPLTGRRTYATLRREGWAGRDFSLVLAMPIGPTLGLDGDCTVSAADDPGFLAAQSALQGYDPAEAASFSGILANLEAPAAGLTFYDETRAPLASLLCVETGGIGVFLNVVVSPRIRRHGYGRRLMTTALSWLAENGAAHAALQVFSANRPAVSLYLSLGFRYRYPYHYCQKPAGTPP